MALIPAWTLLVAFLSISATAHGAILNGVILGGVISCTDSSLATAGTYKVIPQAKVDFVCGSGTTKSVIQSTLTNTAGLYNFLITALDTVLLDSAKCYLEVSLPANSCFINVPTGILRIPIVVLTTIDALVGKIVICVPGALSYILNH